MTVRVLNFSKLKNILDKKGYRPLDALVKKTGIVYVVAVTREKCPGCEKQEPLFEKLSEKMNRKYDGHVEFFIVHSAFSQENKEEAKQCSAAFRTVAFPTYIIGIKDDEENNQETYRAIEPPMTEIERNIKTSVEIAKWFEPSKK